MDKILDLSQLKAISDDKVNLTQNLKCVCGRVENIVKKRENAGYRHFLLFPQSFQKFPFSGSFESAILWEKVNPLPDHKF